MNPLEELVAAKLLRIKAIKIQPKMPFEWVTGWNSPIYCDNRKILSYPQIRNLISVEMAHTIARKYPDVEVIASVATNAIALGVLVADLLGLPFVYVHPTPKTHGFENQIEGDLRPRQNVVVIEDQISVGDNCLKVVEALRKNGGNVQGVLAIFHYELEDTQEKFAKAGVACEALCGFEAAIQHAQETAYISNDDKKVLDTWHKSPATWKK